MDAFARAAGPPHPCAMIGQLPVTLAKTSVRACLAIGLAALGACEAPDPGCSVTYRGGCVPRTVIPGAIPATATPAAASPPAVRLGDPREFADIDDKQCRSYGLTFGTRDYADCRIRLSAQHRGLDPNIGTTP
jgi:hypothetical protein